MYLLQSRSFPHYFKKARVVPLYKKGVKKLLVNYRPISTLHFISNFFEKIMYVLIFNFFNKYTILSSKQFDFMKNRATTDAVLSFTEEIHEDFNNKKYLVAVFLDFTRAFDTVDHVCLLKKTSYARCTRNFSQLVSVLPI